MSGQHIADVVGGIAALVFGVHAIATRQVTFSDENDEPVSWVYGWRAIAIGCTGLAAAAAFFACAAGLIDWWHFGS